MTAGISVANHTIRILNYADSVQEAATAHHDDVLVALYNMHKLFPAYAVITCPVRHDHFFYVSDNCSEVFGYTAGYMSKHFKALSDYFSQVHSADIANVRECMNYLETFMKQQSPETYPQLRIVFHYRFRNADGRYVYLQDEKATLVTEQQKNIHYSLIRNVDEKMLFTGVKMEVFKHDTEIQKLLEYKPSASRNKLSARETDIVRLIKKGLTTKEIAGQLNISHNTVRNIKSKMFEKYNVTNTIELLNLTS
ncbi:MAG: PAS domain-containing protein [Chitinophagaceae bacterium]|nr:PAS domain-containing protein [Chitinophagaceae bacterium]